MNVISFLGLTSFGFYSIYTAIKSLDKIDLFYKEGTRKEALVTKIREVETKIDNTFDEDDFVINHEKINYFYTVKFIDKRGREIEQELEFSTTENQKRNPPFNISIIYKSNKNQETEIILETNKSRRNFYFLFIMGLIFLFNAAYNYDGEIEIIFNFINNLLQ